MADFESKIKAAATKNAQLLETLRETDYARPTYEEHTRYIQELENQKRNAEQKNKALNVRRDQLLKEHEKYRDSHMKRFLFKASGKKEKFQQKAEEGERQYFTVLQESHQHEALLKHLQTQLQEAIDVKPSLQAAAKKHTDAQANLDSLYSSIFGGPTPQYPEEDEKENRVIEAGKAYRAAKMEEETERQAMQLLQQAGQQMRRAFTEINSALSYSRMDMFGGGTFSDMMERNHLAYADQHLGQVRTTLTRAQHSSNKIGAFPNVNINHGNIMRDVFFDNIFTDMAFHDEIKRAAMEMERLERAILGEIQRGKERLATLQAQATSNEEHLDSVRKDLQKARESLFEHVLRNGVESVPSYTPAAQSGGPVEAARASEPEAPPPAYEA